MIGSIISEELRKRLKNRVQTSAQESVCEVEFDPAFPGFDGHFEGNPIVPGVCLVELARVYAEDRLGKPLRTVEISQCRFRSPVRAGQTVRCQLKIRPPDGTQVEIQAEIRVAEAAACQVRLKMEIIE